MDIAWTSGTLMEPSEVTRVNANSTACVTTKSVALFISGAPCTSTQESRVQNYFKQKV